MKLILIDKELDSIYTFEILAFLDHKRGSGWGSGIHYSLKTKPIIHLIKILGYSLK